MLFLVVDDDALSRDLLTLLLEAEGYEIESAMSGEVALERLAHQTQPPPDVVLTDMQMPGLTGEALASALRSTWRNRQTLLLAMSANRPNDAALAAFDGFLLKPFEVAELRAMVSDSKSPVSESADRNSSGPAPREAGPPHPVVIDEDIYTKLGELMPAEQLGQMYALCVGDARKRIARMRALAQAEDDAQYRAEAHAVKGGCGMIGAREIYALAEVAEVEGLSPNRAILDEAVPGTTSVTASLTQMSLACDRLERILEKRTRAQPG